MRLLRLTARLLAIAVLIVALGLTTLLAVIPRLTHGAALTVLTGSMRPTMPPGSLVLVRPVQTAAIDVGDVITFQPDPKLQSLVTHRVVGVNRDGGALSFVTQGDANRIADIKPVVADAVRGEVWFHVPYIGYVKDFAGGRDGILLLVAGPGLLYMIQQLRLYAKSRRRPGRDVVGAQFRTLVVTVAIGSGRHVAVDSLPNQFSGQVLYRGQDKLIIAVTDTASQVEDIQQTMSAEYDADCVLSEPFFVAALAGREKVSI